MERAAIFILRVLWFVISAPFVLLLDGLLGAAEMSNLERPKR